MTDQRDKIQENLDEEEEMTVTLSLDDGRELECVVLTIFPAGGREYIALLPMDDEEAEEGEVYLYRYTEDAEGQPELENIEDDEEYEIVADAFDEFLDSQEYDELVGEDELDEDEKRGQNRPGASRRAVVLKAVRWFFCSRNRGKFRRFTG